MDINGINKNEYKKYANARAQKSKLFSDCVRAFLVGGAICTFAEVLFGVYKGLGITENTVKILVPVTLIFLSALLTGLNVFERIGKFAGAGTLVPITGFANAVAAPAVDTKSEGYVLGVGANMFKVAGPVIVYGTFASAVYGLVYWAMTRM